MHYYPPILLKIITKKFYNMIKAFDAKIERFIITSFSSAVNPPIDSGMAAVIDYSLSAAAASMIAVKSSTLRLAPPMSPPLISGFASSSAALDGFMLPP